MACAALVLDRDDFQDIREVLLDVTDRSISCDNR